MPAVKDINPDALKGIFGEAAVEKATRRKPMPARASMAPPAAAGRVAQDVLMVKLKNVHLTPSSVMQEDLGLDEEVQFNPRRSVKAEDKKTKELAANIAHEKEQGGGIGGSGINNPLIVRPIPGKPGEFYVSAGERRWISAHLNELDEVPVFPRSQKTIDALITAIIENEMREDVPPLDKAKAYQLVMEAEDLSIRQLAARIGVEPSTVSRPLAVLRDPVVSKAVESGTLSFNAARALLSKSAGTKAKVVKKAAAAKKRGGELTPKQLAEIAQKAEDAEATNEAEEEGQFDEAEERRQQFLGSLRSTVASAEALTRLINDTTAMLSAATPDDTEEIQDIVGRLDATLLGVLTAHQSLQAKSPQ